MRRADSVADALGRTARYGNCPRRELRAISLVCTRIDVPAAIVLARQGAPVREFVIVLTGAAGVSVDGRPITGLLAGDHFGDVALLGSGYSPATIVAATPMSLAVVAPDEFDALLDRSPALARYVLDGRAGQLRAGSAA